MSIYLNQRKNDRDAIVGKIKYSREPHGLCYDARLQNCSNEGIEFVASHPYVKNTELFIQSKTKTDFHIQKATVAWSIPDSPTDKNHPSQYRIGAKFIEN